MPCNNRSNYPAAPGVPLHAPPRMTPPHMPRPRVPPLHATFPPCMPHAPPAYYPCMPPTHAPRMPPTQDEFYELMCMVGMGELLTREESDQMIDKVLGGAP